MKPGKLAKLVLFSISIFLLAPLQARADFQTTDTRIDTGSTPGSSESQYPRISCSTDGYVYAVWEDFRNGAGTDIYFNYSSDYGTTWLPNDVRLDTGDTAGTAWSVEPRITNTEDGHIYVVWWDTRNATGQLLFNLSTNHGQSWLPSPVRLDHALVPIDPIFSHYPDISNTEDGYVYVTWDDPRSGAIDIFFNFSSDFGVTWQASDIRIDTGDIDGQNDSYGPHVSETQSGNVYVVWEDLRNDIFNRDIYFNYSANHGMTWQADSIRLDTGDLPGNRDSSYTQISSTENGHVYVVWMDQRSFNYDIFFNYSSDYGSTWQTPDIRLTTGKPLGTSMSYYPSISSTLDGYVYAVWRDYRNVGPNIYFNYSANYGATWQTPDLQIDGNPALCDKDHPQIKSTSYGYVFAVWEDWRYGKYDILFNYSTDHGVTWPTTPLRVDTGDAPGANDSLDPQMSITPTGIIYVTWADSRNGLADIYFNHDSYPFPPLGAGIPALSYQIFALVALFLLAVIFWKTKRSSLLKRTDCD